MNRPKHQEGSTPPNGNRRKYLSGVLGTALGLATISGGVDAAGVETRSESPASFDQIHLDVPADFVVRIGSKSRVDLTAEPKVLRAIRVQSANGRLTVDTQGSFNTQKPITVTITTNSLSEITAGGASDVTVGPIEGDRLKVSAQGSTSISMEKLNLQHFLAHIVESSELRAVGSAKTQKVRIQDSASYDGQELQTDSAELKVTDAGSAEVFVEKDLDVKIVDAGSVTYSGKPAIRQSISDAGSLDTE